MSTVEMPTEVLDRKTSHKGAHMIAKILRQAAALIELHGWRGGKSGYGYCAATAINAVEGKGQACTAIPILLNDLGGNDISDIFRWNDAPERTQREVTDRLRSLADTLVYQ